MPYWFAAVVKNRHKETCSCKERIKQWSGENLLVMWETPVGFLGWEDDPLEEGMATHSNILSWRIPMDRGAWWGCKESDTTQQLSTHTGSMKRLNHLHESTWKLITQRSHKGNLISLLLLTFTHLDIGTNGENIFKNSKCNHANVRKIQWKHFQILINRDRRL